MAESSYIVIDKPTHKIRPHNKGGRFAAKMGFYGILGACLRINQLRPLPKRREAASRCDWAKNKKMTEIFHLNLNGSRYITIKS